MAIQFEGQADFQNIPMLNTTFETVASLPAASTNAKRYLYYNGVPYYSDGASWLPMTGTPPGSSAEMPERTVYVSPSFSNTYPYFSTLEDAYLGSVNYDTIVVYSGNYAPGPLDMSKRSWMFMPETVVVGNTLSFTASYGESIRGSCRFELGTAGNFSVSGGSIGAIILEADSVIEGILMLDCIGGVRVGQISSALITASSSLPYIDDLLFIDANIIHHIRIESPGFKAMVSTNCLGSIDMKFGDLTVEFKKSTGAMASDVTRIKIVNTTTKDCRLKLIDGRLSENWDSGTYSPIYISGNVRVELQHIWVQNNHGACIYIDNNSRNEHLLKIDNCILLGNPAVDSAISGENVHCFGSWGVNDVSNNIAMVTEPLNVGAIW